MTTTIRPEYDTCHKVMSTAQAVVMVVAGVTYVLSVSVSVDLLRRMRDGLLRRSEAAALTWGDVEFRDNGSALLQLRRSKTDQEAEGVTLYIGTEASQALQSIRPATELLDQGRQSSG